MFTLRGGSSHAIAFGWQNSASQGDQVGEIVSTLDKSKTPAVFSIMPQNSGKDYKAREVDVAQPVMAGGPVGGNQGGDYIVQATAFAMRGREGGAMPELGGDVSNAIRTPGGGASVPMVASFGENVRGEVRLNGGDGAITDALSRGGGKPGQGYAAAMVGSAVRRLTPRECERLQGFPDDFTLIPWRKGMAPDGPRYKALGNSMAVPVMAWLGRRVAAVDALEHAERAAA